MPYTKVIEAPNENQAKERTFAVIGSKHNLKRRYIKRGHRCLGAGYRR